MWPFRKYWADSRAVSGKYHRYCRQNRRIRVSLRQCLGCTFRSSRRCSTRLGGSLSTRRLTSKNFHLASRSRSKQYFCNRVSQYLYQRKGKPRSKVIVSSHGFGHCETCGMNLLGASWIPPLPGHKVSLCKQISFCTKNGAIYI